MCEHSGTCPHCNEPILKGEPTAPANGGALRFHRECLLRAVFGSVGHQQKRCACYGGTEDDPPGMTAREAAREAVRYYTSKH